MAGNMNFTVYVSRKYIPSFMDFCDMYEKKSSEEICKLVEEKMNKIKSEQQKCVSSMEE